MAEVFWHRGRRFERGGLVQQLRRLLRVHPTEPPFRPRLRTLLTELDIAKIRLGRWGEAVAINDNPHFATDAPDDRDSRQVQAMLEEIELLFQTLQKSSKRYEIDARQDDLVRFEDKDMQPVVRGLHGRLGVVARQRQKRTGLLKKAAWALYDGKNFDRLVEQITGFVDDLEKLFPATARPRA